MRKHTLSIRLPGLVTRGMLLNGCLATDGGAGDDSARPVCVVVEPEGEPFRGAHDHGNRPVHVQASNNLEEPTVVRVWFDDELVATAKRPGGRLGWRRLPRPRAPSRGLRAFATVRAEEGATGLCREARIELPHDPEEDGLVGGMLYADGISFHVGTERVSWE